ncbi:cytochrome c oxidase cbb3-type subunit 3 [Xanthomonas translucens]
MCSRCLASVVLAALLAGAGGCERERREYHSTPAGSNPQPALTSFQPGGAPLAPAPTARGRHYQDNAFHIGQGGRLFRSYNCNGCHGAGGGAIGPALMDAQWRYGSSIEQIHASIVDGRPNGMPAWRGKLTDEQAWQLAAYVSALAGNVSKAAAPSRRDALSATPPLTQLPAQPTQAGDASAQQPPPQ